MSPEAQPPSPPTNTTPAGEPLAPEGGAAGKTPALWTAWSDYFATGEGRSIMACIAYAKDEKEIQAHFGKTFDPWYAKGCDTQRGVIRNELTCLLWSEAILCSIEEIARRGGWVDAHSWMHFNYS